MKIIDKIALINQVSYIKEKIITIEITFFYNGNNLIDSLVKYKEGVKYIIISVISFSL